VGYLHRVSYCLLAFESLQIGHFLLLQHIIIVLFIIVLSMVLALVQKPEFGRAKRGTGHWYLLSQFSVEGSQL